MACRLWHAAQSAPDGIAIPIGESAMPEVGLGATPDATAALAPAGGATTAEVRSRSGSATVSRNPPTTQIEISNTNTVTG